MTLRDARSVFCQHKIQELIGCWRPRLMVTQDIWFVNIVNKSMFSIHILLSFYRTSFGFSAVFPLLQSKNMLADAPSRRLNVAPWCDQRGWELPTPRFPWRSTRQGTRQQMGVGVPFPPRQPQVNSHNFMCHWRPRWNTCRFNRLSAVSLKSKKYLFKI